MDFFTDSAILKNTSVLVRDILCSNLQNRMMPHSFFIRFIRSEKERRNPTLTTTIAYFFFGALFQ